MNRAEFVIKDDGCYLQVNGEKVENIQINSHQGKVDRGSITEQYDLQKGLYHYREPICTLNFTAEFKNCQQSDVKYELLPPAPQIAKMIEEETVKVFKAFGFPKILYLPKGYFEVLIKYSNIFAKEELPSMPYMGYQTIRANRTWRGLEVLEGREIKVI